MDKVSLVSGLSYFVKERATNHNYHVYDEDAETLKGKLEEGIYKKIQLTYVLKYEDIRNKDMDNSHILSNLLEGIKLLLPYYKLVSNYEEIILGDDNVIYQKI
ncbi:hypothetical protein [Paenisporosarcina sp. TG20]|uniref:hypothetical protein n=1 Tax=Paenisporosarcina sp. TG20 TaxID=1211706 RepID=UPI0002F3D7FA|nr:hypothetical protein [Paenisporosarcina sp. TG20]